MRLREMLTQEAEIQVEQQRIAEIDNRLQQMIAEQDLNMQFLIEFGVRADQRVAFQRLLHEVSQHGGLSLQEAANLIHARDQGNGEEASSESVFREAA